MNERRLFMLIFTLANSRFMSKESTDSAQMKNSMEEEEEEEEAAAYK